MTGTAVRGAVRRVAWYRLRATFRRRLGGYLALAMLIGLVGGVAMASVTAARRTDASYPAFLAGTSPSDLVVQPFTTPAYAPGFVRELARLPHVRRVAVAVPLTATTITPGGTAFVLIAGLGAYALALANLVAALPGRAAARTPAALLLRAE
jgi:hypothetical protein